MERTGGSLPGVSPRMSAARARIEVSLESAPPDNNLTSSRRRGSSRLRSRTIGPRDYALRVDMSVYTQTQGVEELKITFRAAHTFVCCPMMPRTELIRGTCEAACRLGALCCEDASLRMTYYSAGPNRCRPRRHE